MQPDGLEVEQVAKVADAEIEDQTVVDLVREGENGFLYPPGDGVGLRERVRLLVGDDLLRRTMGRAAVAGVQGRSWHALNEQLVRHYREVAGSQDGVRMVRTG